MFKKRIKVTFYMKSGNVFCLKFTKFTISKLSENKEIRKISYEGAKKTFTIDVDEIEACIIG